MRSADKSDNHGLGSELPWRTTIQSSRLHTVSGYSCVDKKQGEPVQPAGERHGDDGIGLLLRLALTDISVDSFSRGLTSLPVIVLSLMLDLQLWRRLLESIPRRCVPVDVSIPNCFGAMTPTQTVPFLSERAVLGVALVGSLSACGYLHLAIFLLAGLDTALRDWE